MSNNDRELLALGTLPTVDLALSEIEGARISVGRYGMVFPIDCILTVVIGLSDPFDFANHPEDTGLKPRGLKPNSQLTQSLLTLLLGTAVPLLFVVGVLTAWMNDMSVATVALGFLALEVAMMVGFRAFADQLWHIEFEPQDTHWLNLDQAIHELKLSRQYMLPTFQGVPIDELRAWLVSLREELTAIAHQSEG